ncbi:LytR/AlgR family response regulator transcription factor [Kordiimonas laminariae]|uniref:LytR/AlgR family response regulator transcription factor n=1 Tax=Kordiimonas laminariae TaxID=2917717 RepID=UPI001FF2B7D4|nr:LytTR family DNA-binding domain-containing protein [Kordiimonas laminariae]MCK0070239.1 LytTR family DNA-binding domain-containing protein [Kordiimonas laminariae]
MAINKLQRTIVFVFMLSIGVELQAESTSSDQTIEIKQVSICSSSLNSNQVYGHDLFDCEPTDVRNIKLFNRSVWIKANFTIPEQFLSDRSALGIFISGSASSAFYVNGHFIGSNGTPGIDTATEIPGKMDGVVYLPRSVLIEGQQELKVYLSNHHDYLNHRIVIHHIKVGQYSDPTDALLKRYWPAISTLGVFLVGILYFGIMYYRSKKQLNALMLCLISFFASLLLVTKVTRGIIDYSYPIHDIRLISIGVSSIALSIVLNIYILVRFYRNDWKLLSTITGVLIIAVASYLPSYDLKSYVSLLISALASIGSLIYLATKTNTQAKTRRAAWPTIGALCIFIVLIGVSTEHFIDFSLFFALASLLSFLFIQQAKDFLREQKQHESEKARANQLAYTLSKLQKADKFDKLAIKKNGKTEWIPLETLQYCRGADDYVELHFEDGRMILYKGTLNHLSSTLPPRYLKVHRSFIVNTDAVVSMTREPSGNGHLELKNGVSVPVSRRIMPKVRENLSAANSTETKAH